MHSKAKEDILSELQVKADTGLTNEEVKKRIQTYGDNRLKEKKKVSNLTKFLAQFKDVMIVILLFAAAISFSIAIMEGDTHAFFEPFLILLIVVCNAVMGVFQENKAEKSLEALMSLSSPNARVIRDGKEQIVDASTLVPGDIIKLDAGDFIPADARLLTASALKSEESALTGESVPSDKQADAIIEEDAPLGDRVNMIYTGCSITNGTAVAVVTATGMNTEMGKIANLLEGAEDTKTPLQIKLAELGKYLGFLALGVCVIIFIIGILEGMDMMEMFMTAVSLAVSAIPEGLPVIVTVVLSIGVERMAKQRAVVKKLPAVETLGSTSIICSDKTGTLTQNKMTLVKAYTFADQNIETISDKNTDKIRELLMYGTLCSNGSIDTKDGKEVHIGDPTETSIIAAAKINDMEKSDLFKQYQRLVELPFDSDRKLMSVVCNIDGKKVVITKGAYDNLITKCNTTDF
ncbi:MAG: cation-translocating P-type ATPase, partial [Coprobacillaceae bacterium]